MISPEYLDQLLELWAGVQLGERYEVHGLGIPRGDTVSRWLRRGGISSERSGGTVDERIDQAELIGHAIDKLRKYRPLWLDVIVQRMLWPGPDEVRAERINFTPDKFKIALGSARRWLREELDA